MRALEIQAPVALLVDWDLTAAAKVLWLTTCLPGELTLRAGLAEVTNLHPATVRKHLARLEELGWYSPVDGPIHGSAGRQVSVPAGLLLDKRVRPQATVLYGLLQTCPGYRDKSGEFTYATLSALAQVSPATVRLAVRELAGACWIQASQANQLAPVRFTLRDPDLERGAAEAAEARRRLEEADYRGEEIMREYLSLLIDSTDFEDNARPGFLVNPLTNERMELDRYYPGVVGFEFHGPQHFHTTDRFPSATALAMQQARDLMKEALCARHGVRLVVIRRDDLRLAAMQQKVGSLFPLRDLKGHEQLIETLEAAGKSYRGAPFSLNTLKRRGRRRVSLP